MAIMELAVRAKHPSTYTKAGPDGTEYRLGKTCSYITITPSQVVPGGLLAATVKSMMNLRTT